MGANIPEKQAELPISIAYLWELHKSIRFSSIPSDNNHSLMPRETLTCAEISSYLEQCGLELNRCEFDAILAIDSIFEKYRG